MKLNFASKCYCCDTQEQEETMNHLFLTDRIVQKLWKQFNVYQIVKTLYPWIDIPRNWEGILERVRGHKPRLHNYIVRWERPWRGWTKYSMDRASKGNPGESAHSFCLRNHEGNFLYAEANKMDIKTKMEAETRAILNALRYCRTHDIKKVIMETDSLVLTNIIRHEWKAPWKQAEEIEEIQELLVSTEAYVKDIYRKANQLADALANEAYNQPGVSQWSHFHQLTRICKGVVNADKSGVPILRIKTRKIKIQESQTNNRT
ncbi:hypothetical protein R3W88_000645 [Solanum pinnatisectum]|uniref:RNase H type-1 domain-containing protein n=1 Tax=Solanum pinnatisectum TaxID=50273 RepID=A0AAV9MHP7_9SOLN|nr:hypothetical protein R3W88_000645 [Solanum pinnatisectum]